MKHPVTDCGIRKTPSLSFNLTLHPDLPRPVYGRPAAAPWHPDIPCEPRGLRPPHDLSLPGPEIVARIHIRKRVRRVDLHLRDGPAVRDQRRLGGTIQPGLNRYGQHFRLSIVIRHRDVRGHWNQPLVFDHDRGAFGTWRDASHRLVQLPRLEEPAAPEPPEILP